MSSEPVIDYQGEGPGSWLPAKDTREYSTVCAHFLSPNFSGPPRGRRGQFAPGPRFVGSPKSPIETKNNINFIDFVRSGLPTENFAPGPQNYLGGPEPSDLMDNFHKLNYILFQEK